MAAKLSGPGSSVSSHDRYDRHDPAATPEQRQQRAPSRRNTPHLSDHEARSTPSSHHLLRRTSRFLATPSPRPSLAEARQVHLEAASVGISPRPIFATAAESQASAPQPQERPEDQRQRRRPRRQLSQDLSDEPEETSTLAPSLIPPRTSSAANPDHPDIHPAVRISRHTHSAILWTLEEALRQPNPFTPDLIEEDADMADITGPGGVAAPAASNGTGATSSRPTAAAAQTGSPSRGIRGPRMIMQERAEREARQRAERELRNLEEMRLIEEQNRQMMARELGPGGAGAAQAANILPQGGDPGVQRRTQRGEQAQGRPILSTSQIPVTPEATQTARPAQMRPSRAQATAQQTAAGQQLPQGQSQGYPGVPLTGGTAPAPAQAGETSATGGSRPRNTFPHAFERWEALSAHWEGLTSFWIRQLQQRSEEVSRDPLSQQLSRQVTDLSAAGANLFHAVVELQRLRASSERKFQRWFFETRADLERHTEVNAMLEAALEEERRGRADAIRDAVEQERANSKTQKQLAEMRKELTISKEEARRAWEELGRREQEERDRTISLQQGLPTIVGGVQVVPMTQGVPSRPSRGRAPRPPTAAA